MTEDSPPTRENAVRRTQTWHRVARFVERRLRVLFVALVVVTIGSYCGRLWWLLDNLTAFVAQYAAIAFLFALAFGLLRSPRWSLSAFALAAASIVRLWEPTTEPRQVVGPTLRILSANVQTSNRDYDRFLNVVRRESPDVLLVMEIDAGWAAAVEGLRGEWPFAVIEPREDNFGIALLSRVALHDAQIVELSHSGVPTIVTQLRLGSETISVVGTHPVPPVRAAVAAERNRQLAAVARLAASDRHHVLVMGDLNTSPWSPYFRDLLRNGKLNDSRHSWDIQPSWPAFFPPMMTPIDHVLSSPGLVVTHRRIGPHIGSDHRPVLATIGRAAP